MSVAEKLVSLQENDLIILRSKKHLEELPERAKILSVREKLAEVEAKAQQVLELRKKCDSDLKRLQDEDSLLEERQAGIQEKIKTSSDYRTVSSLTKDLEGTAKRREKISFEFNGLTERSDKIAGVEKQIEDARAALSSQEEKLIASFKANGAALQKECAAAEQARADAEREIPNELLARYEKSCKSHGGIGVSVLKGGQCSACRAQFHEGQYAKLIQGDDFGECPSCHRIIIVRGLEAGDEA